MNPDFRPEAKPRIWEVGALVGAAADLLAARFGVVRVSGEISASTEATSGHRYFSLKDAHGQQALLRCAMFRRAAQQLSFALRDGLKVEATGRLSVYEPRGDLQFIVEAVQLVGAGSLYEEFLRLKARLTAEGWFDEGRKRPLPPFPRRLGVVSSLGAAALRDVITAIGRRAPHVEVVVFPCLVQGAEAPASIVAALQEAADFPGLDALILARGGGSLEDLWAFNDERVVHALARSLAPVVCGVGHETDITLADFAADVRAATPTAAAELATPLREEELQTLASAARRLALASRRQLERQAQRLDQLSLQVLRPAQVLTRHGHALERYQLRWAQALREPLRVAAGALEQRARRLMAAQARSVLLARGRLQDASLRVQAQDPRQVLQRGYAWVADEQGRPLTSATQVSPGQAVSAVWRDGSATVVVQDIALGDPAGVELKG